MEYGVSKALCNFTFDGENNEIDAATLIKTLASLNTLVIESSGSLYPETKCNLKVTATESGCFIVGLMVVSQYMQNLLTPANITYAKDVISFIKTSLEIKKFLGGEKPKRAEIEKNETVIERKDGQTRQYHANAMFFFENPIFDRSITDIIATASNNTEISGISFQDETTEPIKIRKHEFDELSQPIIDGTPDDENIYRARRTDTCFIKRCSFDGSEKWKLQSDKVFLASISDKEWLYKFQSGEIITVAKMQLIVEIEITYRIVDELPDPNTATYDVIKVLNVLYPDGSQVAL